MRSKKPLRLPPWAHALLALVALVTALAARPPSAMAQLKVPTPAPSASAKAANPADDDEAVAFDSPRASMTRYLAAVNEGRFVEAAAYLELSKADAPKGPELARMLDIVLARKLWLDPGELSPHAAGKKDDGLPANVDEIGRIRTKDGKLVPIRIVRKEARSGDEEPRWVFSAQTVSLIDGLYDELGERWARSKLSPFFFRELPGSFLVWHAGALVLLVLLSALVARPLGFVAIGVAGYMAKRARLAWSPELRQGMKGPARLACALPVIYGGTRFFGLYQPADALVMRGLRAAALVALFWFFLRVVASFGGSVLESDWGRNRPSLRGFSTFSLKVGKFVVWVLGAVTVLGELGYPVGSIITGLGIGSIAIALAAQKTIEHLFGSISILVDQPFRVGDTIRVDGIEGTVETVGLRSTRIRTADRSLVVIPNGKLADMRIESLSARDRTRFVCKLRITQGASEATLARFVALLDARIPEHPKVRREDVRVRISSISDGVVEVDAGCSLETTKLTELLDARQELFFVCLRAANEVGVSLAGPREAPAAPLPG